MRQRSPVAIAALVRGDDTLCPTDHPLCMRLCAQPGGLFQRTFRASDLGRIDPDNAIAHALCLQRVAIDDARRDEKHREEDGNQPAFLRGGGGGSSVSARMTAAACSCCAGVMPRTASQMDQTAPGAVGSTLSICHGSHSR